MFYSAQRWVGDRAQALTPEVINIERREKKAGFHDNRETKIRGRATERMESKTVPNGRRDDVPLENWKEIKRSIANSRGKNKLRWDNEKKRSAKKTKTNNRTRPASSGGREANH